MMTEGGAARAYQMLGNYEINATIGKGGMGVVYRAHDHVLNRTVALKVLREDLRVQESLVSRFQREGRAVAALDHPNIVHVYSVGSIDEIPYIAMEFIEGRPLNEVLRMRKRLDWERALSIAGQVARGLAAAHDTGIFHRDIKPANILVTRDGHAYITDFGIAKVLSADTQLTVDGSRLGTPHYMAPERCSGHPADDLGDIYSLGIVIYQLITGKLPFDANTPATLIEQIASKPMPRVAKRIEDVPEDVDRLVAWMTEKDPNHRPPNATILADAIERVRAGMPLEEEGPNLADALAEFRDTENTPSPRRITKSDQRTETPIQRAIRRTRRRWSKLSALTRACVVAIVAFGLGAAAGPIIFARAAHDPILPLSYLPDGGSNRWQAVSSAAQFQLEAPGLLTAHLHLKEFTIAQVTSAPDGAVMMIQGREATPWAGRKSVVAVNAANETASMIVPPREDSLEDEWAVASAHGSAVGIVNTSDLSANIVDTAQTQSGLSLDVFPGHDVRVMTSLPNNTFVGGVRAKSNSDADWFLARSIRRKDGSGFDILPISDKGAPITNIAVSPMGAFAIYAREQIGSGTQLFAIDLLNARAAPRKIASGGYTLVDGAASAAGRLAGVMRGGLETEFVLLSLNDGSIEGTPITASDAAWDSSTGYVYYIAPDRHGNHQVWSAMAGEPDTAKQRTFLDGGIAETGITISNGWVYAVAAFGESPIAVCLNTRATS